MENRILAGLTIHLYESQMIDEGQMGDLKVTMHGDKKALELVILRVITTDYEVRSILENAINKYKNLKQ